VLWICSLLVVYVWFGYPALLWTLSHLVPDRKGTPLRVAGDSPPSVAIIVAVHNEEAALQAKIENCLELQYPQDRLRIVVASDGSTDGTVRITEELAGRYRNVHLLAQNERLGKTVAQNAAVRLSLDEIVVFSDVDTKFDGRFLERIIGPFSDRSVGCVTGALVWTNPGESAVAAGGDLYWRYEHFMWRLESRLGVLAWGSGACLAVRREAFTPMEAQYGEDCVVPLDVISRGYRMVFQPGAIARETRIANARAEMQARARMTLRSFAGTLSRKHLLNPLRFPGVAWATISHKVLRWLTPYFLVLIFVSNVFLMDHAWYRLTLVLQIAFYVGGVAGSILERHRIRVPLISTIYAFCLMNLAVSAGVAQAIFGRRILAYRSEG
jgi:cellulose synthase/poly-beta-1,6-N-acetylglucosamine synthase-like glycosyltransferase